MADFLTPVSRERAQNINVVTLAFLGDAVQSLYVRRELTLDKDRKSSDIQKLFAKKVSAVGQNELLDKIQDILTDEEREIFRRARNAKKSSKAKNATSAEYSRSTGIEAVFGYLYLIGEYDRIEELLSI